MINKLIILIVIALGVVAIAQLMRVNELTAKLSNRKEEEIPLRDNKFNAKMMLTFMVLFYIGVIWLMLTYGWTGKGVAASTHGEEIDWLLNLNLIIVFAVFFLCNTLLFVFAYKYYKRPGTKAYYFPHDNKIEMIWTVIPAIVLAVIIILGLKAWNNITDDASAESENIELYSYQFGWTARYSGIDNKLGDFDYKLTTGDNPLALITDSNLIKSIESMENGSIVSGSLGVNTIEEILNDKDTILSVADRESLHTELGRKERMLQLLKQMKGTHKADSLDPIVMNDMIVGDTLVLLKGQNYEFKFRAKDVIHSAYFPHFRAQMNTVPGMTTRFKFQPIYTTKEMRVLVENADFEFVLMCNKICGGSHYKMKMPVAVLTADEYVAWLMSKPRYDGKNYFGYDMDATKISPADAKAMNEKKEALIAQYRLLEESVEKKAEESSEEVVEEISNVGGNE